MSSGTFVSLAAVVDQLESMADALPEDASLDALASYVEIRAPLADTLASIDVGPLSVGEKRSLAGRLRRVLDRDQALVTALFARREDVGTQLRAAHRARTAARGYGGRGEAARVLRKTA